MKKPRINKRKIINDPVHGFFSIPNDLIFDIIENPYFQRLRRIRQLGLTYLVYPGAIHNRFQHSLGATHLMRMAIDVIRSKGHEVTPREEEGALTAILLHDIGHAPFSHTLEYSFVENITHEDISLLIMREINKLMDGKLRTAIEIFTGKYPKKFLHQLVSSQLDMDRLDYLKRDSFYTGVSEGVIGSDRIIKMLTVANDELVVEEKGIYSIEKFLIARRLMYWQVYMHKTAVVADQMLLRILQRARELSAQKVELLVTPSLQYFLYQNVTKEIFLGNDISSVEPVNKKGIEMFARLDDTDILASIKEWAFHSDPILSFLCTGLINRKLFRIELKNKPFSEKKIQKTREKVIKQYHISEEYANYFVFSDSLENNAYLIKTNKINILTNRGKLVDIAKASDVSNVSALSKTVKKYFLCYPKNIV